MRNVAIDVETTKLPNIYPWQPDAYLVCVSTADEEGRTQTWFFNHDAADKSQRECAGEINAYLSKFDRLIAHNLKFDLHWLHHIGIKTTKHKLWCTMVVEYLIRGHQKLQGLSLNELGKAYNIPAKKDKVKVYWDAGVETDDVPADLLSVYCEQDALNAMLLFKHQSKKVQAFLPLLALEMEAIRCYQAMEYHGLKVSVHRLTRLGKIAGARLARMDEELKHLLNIPEVTNQWLSRGLFGGPYKQTVEMPVLDAAGIPVRFKTGERAGEVRTTKVDGEKWHPGIGIDPKKFEVPQTAVLGIYSVSKDTIPQLKGTTPEQKRVLEILADYGALSKLKSSYYDSLPKLEVDNIVHSNLNQALTKTGRLSCNAPNNQNLPRGNTGPVKKCFISRFD
jgi:DNA polymerase I-like protein with 3'-5' exonuclease and polymerase domains